MNWMLSQYLSDIPSLLWDDPGLSKYIHLFYKYKGIYETTSFSNSDYQIFSALMHFLCLARNCCFQKANKKPTILSVACTFSVPTGFLLPYLLLTTDHYFYLSTENWLSSVQKSRKGLHEKPGSSGFMHKSLFECPRELLLPPIK